VAAFGMRVTPSPLAHCLRGTQRQALPVHDIPLQAGMSIGMLLVSWNC